MVFVTRAVASDAGRAGGLSGTLSPGDLALIDRVTWGVNTWVAGQYLALGRDRWLDAQLHPPSKDRLPASAQAAIDAMPIASKPAAEIAMPLAAQSRAANQSGDIEQKKAAQQAYQQAMNDTARQAATRSLLRDLYSPDQLREKMTWFWFNHFNVLQGKADIRATIGDYEERALRPYALGRFRDLLEATVKHPAMLRYLDNADNARGHINENYAREIMELHTMGVGSGYTQEDVQELARILTGVGVNFQPEGPKLTGAAQADYIRTGPRLQPQAFPRSHHRGRRLRRGRPGARHHRAASRHREPYLPPDRDLLRRRRPAAGAGPAHGPDVPEDRRRHRQRAGADVPLAGVQRRAQVEIQRPHAVRAVRGAARL
jgi:hypothetical protein